MTTETPTACETCGAHGTVPHCWIEGDCVLPHRMDKPRHPPIARIGRVCEHCITRHREQLTEIVELYAGLRLIVAAGSIPDDTAEHKRPKKRQGSPSPVRLEAWAMLYDAGRLFAHGPHREGSQPLGRLQHTRFAEDYQHTATPDVYAVLAGWVGLLDEALDVTPWDRGSVAACCNALDTYAHTIAEQPWIDDYDAELRWLRIALRRAHGLSDPRPVAECLNDESGNECHGNVWRETGMKCDKCGRPYKGLDAVRLRVHARRQTEERSA